MANKAAEHLRSELDGMVERGELPGAIVHVEQRGEILAQIVAGYQDVASGARLAEDSIFRLYSMSKPITSVAVMMLAEQGRLRLDDPASRFLPELADLRVYESGSVDIPGDFIFTKPIGDWRGRTQSSGRRWVARRPLPRGRQP